MLILLISFVIVFAVHRMWVNYIMNDTKAKIKYVLNGGSTGLALLNMTRYVLGAIILIKIVLKIFE